MSRTGFQTGLGEGDSPIFLPDHPADGARRKIGTAPNGFETSSSEVRPVVVWLLLALVCAVAIPLEGAEPSSGPFLIQGASIHGDQIAFSRGGKIWLVARSGGTARQITRGTGNDLLPVFSPDGSCLAYLRSGERAMDVHLYFLADEKQQRLTHHPSRDFPVNWTPDGKQVLFNSSREGPERLFTMSVDGTLPTAVPLPSAYVGCFSPDGKRIAYTPRSHNYQFSEYRYYRGGKCSPLWIADLESGAIESVTDASANARDPMWIGQRVYYLWDGEGAFNLYVHDLATKEKRKLTNFGHFAARSAASDGKSIVMVVDGGLQVFTVEDESTTAVGIRIPRNDAALRARTVNALQWVQSHSLDQGGSQAVVCARGDVFLVNPQTSEARNVTRSSGVAEREARLSPDSTRLAYFSDVSGDYALHIRQMDAKQTQTVLPIDAQPSYYRELTWSPDSNYLAFSDKHLAVWLADTRSGEVKRIDASRSSAQDLFNFAWAANNRYLAYSKYDENRLPSVCIHDVKTGSTHPVTLGDVHASCPVFDRSGRYLYFLSSANAPTADFGWSILNGLLSSPLVFRHVNAVVLAEVDAAPTLGKQPNPAVNWKTSRDELEIDFETIQDRIVPLAVDAQPFSKLLAGPSGVIYAVVDEWPSAPGAAVAQTKALHRIDLRSSCELKKVVPVLQSLAVSYDGKTVLYRDDANWRLLTFQGTKANINPMSLTGLPAPVDPMREWTQIFREAARLMRDFFYDPHHHGLDWNELERHYREFLPAVSSRDELNVLLRRMLGHVSISHLAIGGGDIPASPNDAERIGLLGADLEISQGHYRFRHVLASGHFDAAEPLLCAPLSQPGARVAEGEYLLAIDEGPIDATKNIYATLRGKASQPVRLTVGPTTDRAAARSITVTTLADESLLRSADWAEHNRRTVETLSGGKLGYFHIAAYSPAGVQSFLRGFFAHRSKSGLVIDQRYNGGGITPDFFIEMLRRRPLYYYLFHEGDDLAVPVNTRVGGPTVLVINEDNGSAAETFALMFRLGKVGTLVGARTYGGVIGPYGFIPDLIDGGRAQIPRRAAYDPAGLWAENEGISPDVAVEILPQDARAGRDPQLEAAVRVALESLQTDATSPPKRPAFPVHP